MVDFLNKLELSGQKYRVHGTVIDDNHTGGFLFPMKYFVSFGTDYKSMYFMSTRLLKDNIDGVCVPQFQLDYIHNSTHPSHKYMVKLCREVHYIWWVNKELELQEWDNCIK